MLCIRILLGMSVLVFVFNSSCNSKKSKKPVKVNVSDSTIKKEPAIRTVYSQWPQPFWTAKAKVFLDLGGNSFPVNVTIRAEKDKYIWFSANAMGLMEVARGRIDRDSIRVHDKFNNRCYIGGMDGLGGFLPMHLEIKQLQHFLMGKVFWDSLFVGKTSNFGDSSVVEGTEGGTSFNARIHQQYNLVQANANLMESKSFVRLQNDDFKAVAGYPIAFRKALQSGYPDERGGVKESKAKIEFSRFEFVEQSPDFSFDLPTDCSRQVLK